MLKPSRAKRLADLLPQALGPAAAKQGFAGAEIMARWAVIVGPEIATRAAPLKLAAPRPQGPEPAEPPLSTLTLRVEGAFALEIQHRIPEIAERVNAHLGWRCVGSVKLRQGSAPAARWQASRASPPPPPNAEEAQKARDAAAKVGDGDLADAIERLGRAALARRRAERS
ncbi:DUF721 domain-containing protein [Hansschlegelia quercus]|uniref:DUF721 domain-containing protein n=1 Tax=Hansschlegelia quercus TaxID=2528245 RepID=A0A4Q9GKP9_9HYPH|nr:DciA family protein [Hansschlegelia quercus]TBN53264.1 DUF721 domain-containing protein [Hansschlegelia quercus]